MKVYIQSYSNGTPHNYNFMNAFQGFREMGFETIPFSDTAQLQDGQPENIVVGYVGTIRQRLKQLNRQITEMDYPEELSDYLGRKVWKTTMLDVSNAPETWPVFVKPLEDKQFTGVVVHSTKDLIGCGIQGVNQEVYCSEVLDFKAEWRCFVRYQEILDVRPYKGDWRLHYDSTVIENAVRDYRTAPAGYAIDFGLTQDGRTLLLEVNDGYALGCYGLMHLHYAKLLSARWAEMTETDDACAFDR